MEYGIIHSIEKTDKEYFTISIIQKVAYSTKMKKFNVWNVKELKRRWVMLYVKILMLHLHVKKMTSSIN